MAAIVPSEFSWTQTGGLDETNDHKWKPDEPNQILPSVYPYCVD